MTVSVEKYYGQWSIKIVQDNQTFNFEIFSLTTKKEYEWYARMFRKALIKYKKDNN